VLRPGAPPASIYLLEASVVKGKDLLLIAIHGVLPASSICWQHMLAAYDGGKLLKFSKITAHPAAGAERVQVACKQKLAGACHTLQLHQTLLAHVMLLCTSHQPWSQLT
jgi:hypothetical protein